MPLSARATLACILTGICHLTSVHSELHGGNDRYREWAVVLQSERRPSRPLVSGEVRRSWAGACLTPKQATQMATFESLTLRGMAASS
jgi:hypothetical protein